MAEAVSLSAVPRTGRGKGASRRARAAQQIPAVIYGRGREPQPLLLDRAALEKAFQGVNPESTVFDLAVDGSTVKTLIREVQRHPVAHRIMHLDFYEIHSGERIRLEMQVHLVGAPEGVRHGGGVLDQVIREVEIEVLVSDIPDRVELDVTDLGLGKSMHVSDLNIPNARILSDPGFTICSVVPPRVEEAPPVVEEITGDEPELIRKPKAEEGEGEGEGEAEGTEE
jgi:large subunit ribosomal protein L25